MVRLTAGRGAPASKVEPPALTAEFVPRERLRALVEAAVDSTAVALLCSHAGTGKTQLLSQWARTGQTATAWVSLDPADNRPGRLWSAVAQAVVRCAPELCCSPVRPSGSGADDPEAPLRTEDLLAELETLPAELRLVLDDIQELTAPAVLDELRTLIRYRPTQLSLVLAGRTTPPLSLARLRLEGGAVDLPGDQLRFSIGESASLFSLCGAKLSRVQVEQAHALTGGWVAGLRLTARAVSRSVDVAGLLTTFPGTERSIADYVGDEVLGKLPDADRAFLQDISICPRVPPALATELTGRDDALAVLGRLERETSLVSSDGLHGDFAVQTLLRALLDNELARRVPARRTQLRIRAADWFAANDRPLEALDHARTSGDDELLGRLVRAWAVPLLLAGDHEALRRACAALEPDAHTADPGLHFLVSTLHAIAGDLGAVVLLGSPTGEAAELRALHALDALAATDADAPGPERPGDDRARRAEAAASRTLAAAADGATRLLASGDRSRAVAALTTACREAGEFGHDHLAMQCASLLATAAAVDADVSGMVAHGAEATTRADRGGWGCSAWSVAARGALAYGSLLGARPNDAGRYAADLLAQIGDGLHPAQRLLLHVVHGAAEADGNRLTRGLEEMQRARTAFADRELVPEQAALAGLHEHETAVRLERLNHARAVRCWLGARVGPTAEVVLMSVREALAVGQSGALRRTLRPVLDGSAPTLRPEAAIEAQLLVVGDAHLAHDSAGARRQLIDALERAAPLELMRPFTHASRSVRELMALQVGSFGSADGFARRALVAGLQGRPARRTALSDRESTILRLLPSLSTTTEIAEDLHVSPNTVKTQVSAIYSKLGVPDRRAAVVAAYDAGLLGDAVEPGARPWPAPGAEFVTVPRQRGPADRATAGIRSG